MQHAFAAGTTPSDRVFAPVSEIISPDGMAVLWRLETVGQASVLTWTAGNAQQLRSESLKSIVVLKPSLDNKYRRAKALACAILNAAKSVA